jgi:hypothetical protein
VEFSLAESAKTGNGLLSSRIRSGTTTLAAPGIPAHFQGWRARIRNRSTNECWVSVITSSPFRIIKPQILLSGNGGAAPIY